MTAVRKLFLFLSTFMLIVTLLVLNTTWVVKNTVTDREVVKSIIKDSGFYENIIDEIVKTIEKEIKSEDSKQNYLDKGDPGIDIALLARAADKVFTPENIQQKLELVLDGSYNWLDGDTPDLQFVLDLSNEKLALAESLADEVTTRIDSLPACSADQLATAVDVDLFSIECVPPEVSSKIAEFQQEFAGSDEFLADVVLSASDIKIEVDGVDKPISEAVPSVPSWYQFAQQFVWYMIIATLIWVLLVMFLSKNLRHGAKHSGVAFLVAGILVGLSALSSSQVVNVIKVSSGSIEETIVLPLVKETVQHAAQVSYSVSIVYTAIFAIAVLCLYLTRPKKESVEATSTNTNSADKPVDDKSIQDKPELEKPETTKKQSEVKQNEPANESEIKEAKDKIPKI